ncbi:unnamed protein product, partial [marine sediment metagenome]
MTKVVDWIYTDGYSAYTAAFILDEAGIEAATGSDFVVTWDVAPSATPAFSSVFLENVDQSDLVGETGTGGSTTTEAETPALSTNDGDMAFVAGSCGNTGTYSTINGFTEAIEVAPDSADGVAGYLAATGSDVTPGVSHTNVNRQSVIGFVIQAAAVAPPTRTLTTSSTAGGSVTTPGEPGPFDYNDGQVVPIVATADLNYHFVEWTGDISTIADPCSAITTITMDGAYSVTANFAIDQRSLTTAATAGGTVTEPGIGTYPYDHGSDANLVATADLNYHFVEWTGDISTIADPCSAITTITMDGAYSVTANFAIDQRSLTTAATAGGTVTEPGIGTYPYDHGSDANLVATADLNYHFVEWTGDISTIADPCSAITTITMDGAYSVTANFAIDQRSLTTAATAGGTVTEPGIGTYPYDHGSDANLVATADLNYHFVEWTGDISTIAD